MYFKEIMEILFSSLDLDLQEKIKDLLLLTNDLETQPNWDCPENITFRLRYGANSYNLLVWQGQQYWLVNSILK